MYATPPAYSNPQAYYNTPATPMQFAASRNQVQSAAPTLAPQVTDRMPAAPNGESIAPGMHGSHSYSYDDTQDLGQFGYGSGCESGCAAGCEPVCEPCCEPYCGPCFYTTVGGLIFTRNRHRFQQLSYDDTNLVGQVLSTDSGMGRWDAGGQITMGWYLNPCCGCALEMTYWGIYGDMVETTVYTNDIPGNLNTAFDFSPLNIGATNVNDLFDAAQVHRVRRDYDVHNVEVNLVGGRFPGLMSGPFQLSYLTGFRFLRFTEEFFYASADTVPSFGADPANEAYLDIDVSNNLWGWQFGGRADWFVTPRFSVYAAPKFGLYANYMEQHSRVYNANGTAVVGPGNPLAGGVYDITSDKTIVSFLGELDAGLSYQFLPCLGASIGYRAVAISGLAYATDQIPSHFADLPGVAMIDSNADMILHGGYAAVTLTW